MITHPSGLSVKVDEETGSFNLEWDPEEHPEWNFLSDMSSEDFCKMLLNYCETLGPSTIQAEIQHWGQGSGTTESIGDSGSESCNTSKD